jgi:hypothetical protein
MGPDANSVGRHDEKAGVGLPQPKHELAEVAIVRDENTLLG